MLNHENDELEKMLRSLPTAKPPAELRSRLLRAYQPRHSRPIWKSRLVWALCILALLALDVGLDSIQSARLSRLIGDGRRITAPAAPEGTAFAFLQSREMLKDLLETEDFR
jgi:hypothetical protein